MKEIVIFGSGNQAKLIYYEISTYKSYNLLGFIDPLKKELFIDNKKKKLLKSINKFKSKKKLYAVIGIGNNFIRKKIFEETNKLNLNIVWEKIISKKTSINKNVKIGEGTFICQGANISANSVIGKHCIINSASSIDHDNQFGDFSSTGPGAILGGNVKIGSMCHLGIGSVIKNNININDKIIIGSNSYVNKNLVKGGVYFGSPANFIKKISKNYNYLK